MEASRRLIGLDFARAWALFGMLIVNFIVITNAEHNGPAWLITVTSLFQGRASALFVLLAGIGISLMSRKAAASQDKTNIMAVRQLIWKRSLFLFIIGLLLYVMEWTGDILHYYGVYLFIAAALITVKDRTLYGLGAAILITAQCLQLIYDTFTGWGGPVPFMNYVDFWTLDGFIRNLFFNGYHPVFPWFCFFIVGLLLGRINLNNKALRNKLLIIGAAVTITIELLSKILTYLFIPSMGSEVAAFLFNTGPILPNILYILSATGSAIVFLIVCLYLTEKYDRGWFINAIVHTGQLTLTHYVSHVVIGIGILIVLNRLENQSLIFASTYSVCFFLLSILFSVLWRKKFSRGPIELLMRKITG
ncbi:DUF418 domain-containing protein [Bacillus sp. FJAT-28004]|uniref:DUF418 domain-containing protein n=1 Tax=Bacillus sp. FJAT-28004 TaxID=1679165 RepID=UPI00128FC4A5|nr:heparan-alpha-glucosaminide N-acetyltransferase domain-containing protein [Bacillus sp. FJAT-28004]